MTNYDLTRAMRVVLSRAFQLPLDHSFFTYDAYPWETNDETLRRLYWSEWRVVFRRTGREPSFESVLDTLING